MNQRTGLVRIRKSVIRRGIFVLITSILVLFVNFYPGGLNSGSNRVWARCPNSCVIEVCTRWVPEGHPQCPVGGSGGGCCLRYDQTCDPSCDTGTDAPPTISGSVTCAQWGENGWCVSSAQLVLRASDPQGYALAISGNAGSVGISCNDSCTIDLPPGAGVATYLVSAATSNLTTSGSTGWAYDPELPVPDVDFSGTSGANGWYISPVNVSAAGSDSISGVAGASIFVDGGPEQSAATISDGVHRIAVDAIDQAGNTASTVFSLKVDTTTPVISSTEAGAPGTNSWYVSEVQINAAASDATSGVDAFETRVDGGSWLEYTTALTLTDGGHTLQLRATDKAGNVTTTARQFQIDTAPPVITPTLSGSGGSNGWYLSAVQVGAAARDDISGLDRFEVSMDDGAYQIYTAAITLSSGQHSLQFRATDEAGNISQITQTVSTDLNAPVIDLPAGWTLGSAIPYTVADNESGLANVRVVIEDENERYPKVVWEEDAAGGSFDGEMDWDGKFDGGLAAPPGEYLVWVKAGDRAGNESVKLGRVTVSQGFNLFSFLLPTRPPRLTATAMSIPMFAPTTAPDISVPAPGNATIVVSSSFSGRQSNTQPVPKPVQSDPSTSSGQALPLASAAMAAAAAAAAYALSSKEGERGSSGYLTKTRAKKRAEIDAEGEAQQKAKEQQAQILQIMQADKTEDEKLAEYKATERYQSYAARMAEWERERAQLDFRAGEWAPESADLPQPGGAHTALAAPALKHLPDGTPPPWQPVLDFVKWVGDGISRLLGGHPKPAATPVPDLDALVQQAMATLAAQATQTAQASPTSISTPIPTPTATLLNYQAYKTTGPLTPWEAGIGGRVAENAHTLLSQADKFYFWGTGNIEANSNPPIPPGYDKNLPIPLRLSSDIRFPWGDNIPDVYQYTGGRMPFVCGDVPDWSYYMGGYNLQLAVPLLERDGSLSYPNRWARASYTYLDMLKRTNSQHIWNVKTDRIFTPENLPELGDIVITQTHQDPLAIIDENGYVTAGHVVLVVEVHGYTPDQIIIIEGNPDDGTIVRHTLQELENRVSGLKHLIYGHPNLSVSMSPP